MQSVVSGRNSCGLVIELMGGVARITFWGLYDLGGALNMVVFY